MPGDGSQFEKIDLRPVFIGNKLRYYVDHEADTTALNFLNALDLDMPLKAAEIVRGSEDLYWKQNGAMLSRQLYYQGIEVLFSLLFAALQSPRYAVAWLINYTNNQLRELVRCVAQKQSIPVFCRPERVGWEGLIEFLLSDSSFAGDNDFHLICRKQAGLVEDLAHDLVNSANVQEYNAIKHGFRVRQAGMKISLTPNDSSGKPLSEKTVYGVNSENGSHFPVQDHIDIERNIWRVSFRSVPWQEEAVVQRLEFATMWSKIARSVMIMRISSAEQEITVPTIELVEKASKRPGSMINFHFKRDIMAGKLIGDLPLIDPQDDKYSWPSSVQLDGH